MIKDYPKRHVSCIKNRKNTVKYRIKRIKQNVNADPQYKFYSFIKDKPEVFFLTITLFFTLITGLINLGISLFLRHYYVYWGYSNWGVISANTVLLIFLFCIAYSFSELFIISTGRICSNQICIMNKYLIHLMYYNREIKQDAKNHSPNWKNENRKIIKDIRKDGFFIIRHVLYKYIGSAIAYCFLVYVSIEAILSAVITSNPLSHFMVLIVLFLYTLLLLISEILPNTIISWKELSRYFKEKTSALDFTSYNVIEAFKEELPLKKLAKLNIKDFLSDSNILSLIKKLAIILVISFLFLLFVLMPIIRESKSFNIVTIEEKEYVLIYSDAGYMYLNEAEISGDEISIYVDNHHVENREGMSYRRLSFETVNRIQNNYSV